MKKRKKLHRHKKKGVSENEKHQLAQMEVIYYCCINRNIAINSSSGSYYLFDILPSLWTKPAAPNA